MSGEGGSGKPAGEPEEQRSIIDRVARWFETGRASAIPADTPWTVSRDEANPNRLEAYNPLFISPVVAEYLPKKRVLRLMVRTGINVYDLDTADKQFLYTILLRANEAPLASAFIDRMSSEVVFTVDLTTESLSEEEFNHSLAELMIYTLSLYRILKEYGGALGREVNEQMIKAVLRLPGIIRELYKKGVSKEELVEILSRIMEKEEAERLVSEILKPGSTSDSDSSTETFFI